MPPALFAFDVDGTLLDSSGAFGARTAAALARVRASGAVLVVATGRPWRIVERTIELIGGADWAVCSNGSTLVEVATGAVHRDVFLPPDVAPMVVGELRDRIPGIAFGFEFESGAVAEAGWARRLPPGIPLGAPVPDVLELLGDERGPLRGIVMFHDDYDAAPHRLVELVRAHVVGLDVEVRATGLAFIDVGVADEHKARGLAVLADLLGIAAEDTVAFGDEENDIEMLRWAGLGVAMANAPAGVRAVADVVAPANDDDGVAVVVERILDGVDVRQSGS